MLRRRSPQRHPAREPNKLGPPGIERNGDTKSLSYFFAGRPGIDGAFGVDGNAAVAARGNGDGDGDRRSNQTS